VVGIYACGVVVPDRGARITIGRLGRWTDVDQLQQASPYPRARPRPRRRPEPEKVGIDKLQAMQIMYALGDSYSRIAHALGVSKRTVVHHVDHPTGQQRADENVENEPAG
jgi:hypothetical protein